MRNSTSLEDQIEQLVLSHLNALKSSTEAAVSRAFARTRASAQRERADTGGRSRAHTSGPLGSARRRSSREMEKLCERLQGLVLENPGSLMVTLAEMTELPVCQLQRPMAKLKARGRVRSVGDRNGMRYFPALPERG